MAQTMFRICKFSSVCFVHVFDGYGVPFWDRDSQATGSGRAKVAGRRRDDVMSSGSQAGADTDLYSAGQMDAAERRGELITRLVRRRAASGLSQAGVARLMQTSQSAVARLESGQHDTQLSTLTRYAEALGLSLDVVEDTETQAAGPSAVPGAGAAKAPPGGPVPV